MRLIKHVGQTWFWIVIGVYGSTVQAGDIGLDMSWSSWYLDSESHGYQETDLDAMAVGLGLIYPLNPQITWVVAYQRVAKGFTDHTVDGGGLTGQAWSTEWQFAMKLSRIKPYLALGIGQIELANAPYWVKRLGVCVEQPLSTDWSLNASYTLNAASGTSAKVETQTQLGLRYYFR